jgi:hypothetical protein
MSLFLSSTRPVPLSAIMVMSWLSRSLSPIWLLYQLAGNAADCHHATVNSVISITTTAPHLDLRPKLRD